MTRATVIAALCAAIVAGLLGSPVPLRAAECPGDDDAPYDIDLEVDTPNARLHHDRSISDLGQMAIHSPRGRVLGLAKTALQFGWRVRFGAQAAGEGYCVWVSGLSLTVRYPAPDIYVAREYRKGSCQYRTILSHEAEHVRISRATIERYLPRLHMLLTSLRIPTARRPVFVASAEGGESRVRALMRDLVEPVYREMAAALVEAQADLDSPASYERYRKRCRKW